MAAIRRLHIDFFFQAATDDLSNNFEERLGASDKRCSMPMLPATTTEFRWQPVMQAPATIAADDDNRIPIVIGDAGAAGDCCWLPRCRWCQRLKPHWWCLIWQIDSRMTSRRWHCTLEWATIDHTEPATSATIPAASDRNQRLLCDYFDSNFLTTACRTNQHDQTTEGRTLLHLKVSSSLHQLVQQQKGRSAWQLGHAATLASNSGNISKISKE